MLTNGSIHNQSSHNDKDRQHDRPQDTGESSSDYSSLDAYLGSDETHEKRAVGCSTGRGGEAMATELEE